jgi:hypothetical protein
MDLAPVFDGSHLISDNCSQIESGAGAEIGPPNAVSIASNHRITPLETQVEPMVDSVIAVAQGVADVAWRTATRGLIHPCSQCREFPFRVDGSIVSLRL